LHCLTESQPDAIIHLGGGSFGRPWSTDFKEIDSSIEVNLHGTLSLLKAIEEIQLSLIRFIRIGGLLEYGNGSVPFDESQREQPVSIYPAIQVATTMILNAIHRQLSFPIVTLRFASVYGPGRSFDFFIPSLIKHCLEGRNFSMTSGEQVWDMVYIEDVVDACEKAINSETDSGEIINIGSGRGYKLREIAELITKIIGGNSQLKIGALPDAEGGIPHLICKIEKAKRLLKWEPHTKLEDGLKVTIDWYKENINIIH
jgi:nucleoside-diphosphate-sugar epimerase